MDMQLGKGPKPKPEISSVAVSGMVMTFQPFQDAADERGLARRGAAGQDDADDAFGHGSASFS